jgi:hypothetical protein
MNIQYIPGFALGLVAGFCIAFTIYVCWQVYKEVKRLQSVRRNPFVPPRPPEPLNTSREYVSTLDSIIAKQHKTEIHYQTHGDLVIFFGTCRCGWMTTKHHQDADEVSKAIDEHYALMAMVHRTEAQNFSDRIN